MYINVNTEKIGYGNNFWLNSFSFEVKYYKSTLANIIKRYINPHCDIKLLFTQKFTWIGFERE